MNIHFGSVPLGLVNTDWLGLKLSITARDFGNQEKRWLKNNDKWSSCTVARSRRTGTAYTLRSLVWLVIWCASWLRSLGSLWHDCRRLLSVGIHIQRCRGYLRHPLWNVLCTLALKSFKTRALQYHTFTDPLFDELIAFSIRNPRYWSLIISNL